MTSRLCQQPPNSTACTSSTSCCDHKANLPIWVLQVSEEGKPGKWGMNERRVKKRQRNRMFKVPGALAMPYAEGVVKHLTQWVTEFIRRERRENPGIVNPKIMFYSCRHNRHENFISSTSTLFNQLSWVQKLSSYSVINSRDQKQCQAQSRPCVHLLNEYSVFSHVS